MDSHVIFGVHVADRTNHAGEVQNLLTQYGCNIKTRIGLHEVSDDFCSPNGVMLLEMFGDRAICQELFDKLSAVGGVEVQQMVFDH